jgi:hypothetical protein
MSKPLPPKNSTPAQMPKTAAPAPRPTAPPPQTPKTAMPAPTPARPQVETIKASPAMDRNKVVPSMPNPLMQKPTGKLPPGAVYKSGGMTASKRADGIAQRGKTKGTMVMCGGGMTKGKK